MLSAPTDSHRPRPEPNIKQKDEHLGDGACEAGIGVQTRVGVRGSRRGVHSRASELPKTCS